MTEIRKGIPALKDEQNQRQLTFVMVYLTVDKQTLIQDQQKFEIIKDNYEKEQAIRFPPGAVIQYKGYNNKIDKLTLPENMDVVVLLHDGLIQLLTEKNLPLLKNYDK